MSIVSYFFTIYTMLHMETETEEYTVDGIKVTPSDLIAIARAEGYYVGIGKKHAIPNAIYTLRANGAVVEKLN